MRDLAEMWGELKSKLDILVANTHAGRTAILPPFNQLRPLPITTIAEYITRLLDSRQQLEGSEQAITNETFLTDLIITLPTECNTIVNIITYQLVEHQTINYVITTLVEWETSVQNRRREVSSSAMGGSTMTSGYVLLAVKGYDCRGNGRKYTGD